jgi:uncharacterized protein
VPTFDEPFAPEGVVWLPVSGRLATGRRLVAVALTAVAAAVLVGLSVLVGPMFLLGLVVLAIDLAWTWWLIGRQVGAMGYAERAEDLLVRKGIMFRSIVVVPYGRMQFVDVQAGPMARRLGYSAVQLHTASPGTDASIDGLPPQEASRLRDRLARRGQARLAGL